MIKKYMEEPNENNCPFFSLSPDFFLFLQKCSKRDVPSMEDITNFHKNLNKSTSMLFNASTGLPTQSSPVSVLFIYSDNLNYWSLNFSIQDLHCIFHTFLHGPKKKNFFRVPNKYRISSRTYEDH